jgi:hypothetical protein
LARLGKGGVLAGRPVRAGSAVVLTEEPDGTWLERLERHGIGDEVSFGFGFDQRRTEPEQWYQLITDLLFRHPHEPIDLLVVDTIGTVLPAGAETNAGLMKDLLGALRQLCQFGVAVLLMHHPRKGPATHGQVARGTGALPAGVDILVEFDWAGPRTADNRRRVMRAWSRQMTTPPRMLLELDPDGKDYRVVADPEPAAADGGPPAVLAELLADPNGRTFPELRAAWSAGEHGCGGVPSERTLFRWLAELAESGWLTRTGRGHRFDPYRYRKA